VSEQGRLTRLFVARWPSGITTLISADSLEDAFVLLDDVDDPGSCEVTPYVGNLWLTVRPSDDPAKGLLDLCHRPEREIDSQRDLIDIAYPVLSQLLEAAERATEDGDTIEIPIAPSRWVEATAIEADRILASSRAAYEAWLAQYVDTD
jgi:hypothetical protein